MTEIEIESILQSQKQYFAAGATRSIAARLHALGKLKTSINFHREELETALQADLGKSKQESDMCEIDLTLSEITWMQRHVGALSADKTVPTPLAQFAAHSFRSPSPYGNVLIMSPWNYPVLLTLEPLVDALAAGNTAIVKPSAYAPETGKVLQTILEESFAQKYVAVITGGRAENQALLRQKFDMIFFTGSKAVGTQVLHSAADYLTPVVLELGGKSPTLVDATANLRLAAKRIVFGKFLNCGQTCVAPDYILCDERVKDDLIRYIKKEICIQFGAKPLENKNYGKIINEKHFNRILGLIEQDKVVCGGQSDASSLRIAPTVMQDVSWDDAVMQEEIFGPVLPILTYSEINSALSMIQNMAHPLAFYLFSTDKAIQRKVLNRCSFGGGCINDVVIHLATSAMPFGGVGESGMGCYHGKAGFEAFSHTRSIVDKKNWIDLPIRYQPYFGLKRYLAAQFMKF